MADNISTFAKTIGESMADTICTKHRSVLTFLYSALGRAQFVAVDDDTGVHTTRMTLVEELWEDMGSPRVVTVTVEPGDLLNEGENGER